VALLAHIPLFWGGPTKIYMLKSPLGLYIAAWTKPSMNVRFNQSPSLSASVDHFTTEWGSIWLPPSSRSRRNASSSGHINPFRLQMCISLADVDIPMHSPYLLLLRFIIPGICYWLWLQTEPREWEGEILNSHILMFGESINYVTGVFATQNIVYIIFRNIFHHSKSCHIL
jgi:hypothetical protein